MKIGRPGLFLIVLTPLVAELLSGSTPGFRFFSPFVFVVYLGFYGCGALVIREIVARRKRSVLSTLFYGAAFGCLEEGIVLKSWFDPGWMGAAITSQSLRVGGFNALQPFMNIVYHAVISIMAVSPCL